MRTRIVEGIHLDRYGYDVRVKAHGVQLTKRFKPGTPLDTMKTWRLKTRDGLRSSLSQNSNRTVALHRLLRLTTEMGILVKALLSENEMPSVDELRAKAVSALLNERLSAPPSR